MATTRWRYFLPFMLVVAACSFSEPLTNGADNWIKIEADEFSFWIPEFLSEVAVRGIDSSVRRWESDEIAIQSDYGRFSDPLTMYSGQKDYLETNEQIDDQAAKIVSFQLENGRQFTAVHFPDVGQELDGKVLKLTLVVEANPHVNPEVALQIVKSVRLKQ